MANEMYSRISKNARSTGMALTPPQDVYDMTAANFSRLDC